MADFNLVYPIIRKHEGNYVNHNLDAGAETYGGIARKFWPTWEGWKTIDVYKKAHGEMKRGDVLPAVEPLVKSFYKKLWDGQKFSLINNQSIANIIYDWMINSGSIGIKKTQEIMRDKFHADVQPDGQLGVKTVTAINANAAAAVFKEIKDERVDFYIRIVARKPDQSVFMNGWMNRINSFEFLK